MTTRIKELPSAAGDIERQLNGASFAVTLTGVIFQRQAIDLFSLWKEVQSYGGFDSVEKSRASTWKTIGQKLRNQKVTAGMAKKWYKKHLLDFEHDAEDTVLATLTDGAGPPIFEVDSSDDGDLDPDRSNISNFAAKLENEIQFALDGIICFKMSLKREFGDVFDEVTRPLEETLDGIRKSRPVGKRTVALGLNGIGKSFLFDLVLRVGCATQVEYQTRNQDSTDPIDAVLDEATR